MPICTNIYVFPKTQKELRELAEKAEKMLEGQAKAEENVAKLLAMNDELARKNGCLEFQKRVLTDRNNASSAR